MIVQLYPGEVVVAEKIDRISRLPLAEAEQLVGRIRTTGAKLAVPGLADLSDIAAEADGAARIVLESVQELLLKLAWQVARHDYEMRRERQRQGVQLWATTSTISSVEARRATLPQAGSLRAEDSQTCMERRRRSTGSLRATRLTKWHEQHFASHHREKFPYPWTRGRSAYACTTSSVVLLTNVRLKDSTKTSDEHRPRPLQCPVRMKKLNKSALPTFLPCTQIIDRASDNK